MGAEEDIRENRQGVKDNAGHISTLVANQASMKDRTDEMAERQKELGEAVVSVSSNVEKLTGSWSVTDVALQKLVDAGEAAKTAKDNQEAENALWWSKFRNELTPTNVMLFVTLLSITFGLLSGELTPKEAIDQASQVKIPLESKAPVIEAVAPDEESPEDATQ